MKRSLILSVITSFTGEKAADYPKRLTLEDFQTGPAHVARREKETTDSCRTGGKSVRVSSIFGCCAGCGCELIWIEELIEVAERSGSAPVYALLKRPYERHVTMQAFDNPVFVEDVVRNAAALLKADLRVASFSVRAVNHESIHDHNAFAVVVSNHTTSA
ncbi:MAG: GTP cyclohydrolase, FolE2/MptA family [Verrucomicrobiota bacterium]